MATDAPTPTAGKLSGKLAVITGGGRGIGLAIAWAFASEGCNLVITGREEQRLRMAAEGLRTELGPGKSATPQITAKSCDVRDAAAVERLFQQVRESYGRLDILVNNAGISQSAAPVEQTSIELWRDIIETNLTGTFLCTRFAIPLMKRGATILNMASVAARSAFPGASPYNASKAAILNFSLTVRQELKDRGIRVTALLPGATDTDMWRLVMPDAPRERMTEATDIANLALAIVTLSPRANLTELALDPMAGSL